MSICRTCSGAISEIRSGRYCSDKCKSERKLKAKGTLSMEEFIEMCINVSALRGRVAQQMKEN